MRVATKIDIPLLTWDFSKEYKKEVADYMIREYKAGRTPNPDVMCNREIKFGLFLKKALKEGADFIATGHYVRLKLTTSPVDKRLRKSFIHRQIHPAYHLLKAKDKNKDQSYFLWTLTQEQLKRCLFPIGDYTKPEVRKMAKKFGLSTHSKKDSQGVCFIGELDMKEFLKHYIKPEKGKILDLGGNLIGSHDGMSYYTIGQRHGLDIKNGNGPYYVVRKDVKRNVIYVGSNKDLLSQRMQLTNINWINRPDQPVDKRLAKSFINRDEGLDVDVRIRYRAQLSKAVVDDNGEVVFKKPESAITPGQSAVLYKGEEMLGGGIIE
jgi:tRNA-specific 2-thiouridylase